MELLAIAVAAIFLIWAFRIEKNTARAAEALERLEKLMIVKSDKSDKKGDK